MKDLLKGIGISQDNHTILLLCNYPVREKIPVYIYLIIVLSMLNIIKNFAEGTKMAKTRLYPCENEGGAGGVRQMH